jgi:CheY-like chemotaxis protein
LLILEDQVQDAELTVRQLRDSGIDCSWERVDTEAAFRDALSNPPDLIISDSTLPGFNAISALAIARTATPQVPFIVVSGAPWDHHAQDLLAGGAADYVCKADMRALAPAVRRALTAIS